MAEGEEGTGTRGGSMVAEAMTGAEKLQQLKARLFPPETRAHRVARALEGLRNAVKPSKLDPDTLKYLAQSADLEGE